MLRELEPLNLSDLSRVQVEFFRYPFTVVRPLDFLIVKCIGEVRKGLDGDADCTFIIAMSKAALVAYRAIGIVFDFSQLSFDRDDGVNESFLRVGDGEFPDMQFPTLFVVSALSRDGLSQKLNREKGESEVLENWLFDSLELAIDELSIRCCELFGPSGEFLIQ